MTITNDGAIFNAMKNWEIFPTLEEMVQAVAEMYDTEVSVKMIEWYIDKMKDEPNFSIVKVLEKTLGWLYDPHNKDLVKHVIKTYPDQMRKEKEAYKVLSEDRYILTQIDIEEEIEKNENVEELKKIIIDIETPNPPFDYDGGRNPRRKKIKIIYVTRWCNIL